MMNEDKKLYETFKTHFAFLGVLLNARGHAGQRGLVLDKLEMEQLDGEIKEARDTIEEIQGKMKDTMDADHIRVLREIKEITKNATNRTLMIDACRWHKLHEIIRCEMKFSPALNTTKLKAHYYFIEYCRPVLGLEVHRLKGAPIESEESDESPPSVVDRYVNLYQMAKFMLANGLLKKEFLDRHRGCSHEEILHRELSFHITLLFSTRSRFTSSAVCITVAVGIFELLELLSNIVH